MNRRRPGWDEGRQRRNEELESGRRKTSRSRDGENHMAVLKEFFMCPVLSHEKIRTLEKLDIDPAHDDPASESAIGNSPTTNSFLATL